MVGDSSGKTMVQNRRIGPAPSMAAASITELRDRLQARQEEQEIVGDLFPRRRQHDQRHGVVAVEQRIPVDAHRQRIGRASAPSDGWNMKSHSTPATAGATA